MNALHVGHNMNRNNNTNLINKYNKQIRETVLELFRTATHFSIECKEFLY